LAHVEQSKSEYNRSVMGASAGPRTQSESEIGAMGSNVGRGVIGIGEAVGVPGVVAGLRGIGTQAVGTDVGVDTTGAQPASTSATTMSHPEARPIRCLRAARA
jgi:hypothetical protein